MPSSSLAATRVASASPPDVAPLRRSQDFQRVLRTGRRRSTGGLVVVSAPGVDGVVRVGLVAGRKVGTAVARNRAKRRLRHAARVAALVPGRDYVLIATADTPAAPFGSLVEALEEGG